MVVGAVIDDRKQPICCEMWPGNTADVTTLLPIVEKLQKRFNINRVCIVADRGMISAKTFRALESADNEILYILGVRMRRVKEIKEEVLSVPGRYKRVRSESSDSKDPAPLKVKEVQHNGHRYVICANSRQARKDAQDRETIIAALREKMKQGPKSMVVNKGYRKYLKVEKGGMSIDEAKG